MIIMNDIITARELLYEAEGRLHSLEFARLDAELLLCNVMHLDRSKLFASPEMIIPLEKAMEYRRLINKRSEGQPTAYLTGKKEFWSLELMVNQYTLVPRPETECLVELALSKIPRESDITVADLGTGSGAIAIAIATERPACTIIATDICIHALEIARLNASSHGTQNINFMISNWFENLDKKFNLIISNPPYIRNDDKHLGGDGIAHEPKLALRGGNDGMNSITSIVKDSVNHLINDGWLLIEHGHDQADKVRAIYQQHGFIEIQSHCDYSGIERITSGKYKYDRI